jgi:hypothetical protein
MRPRAWAADSASSTSMSNTSKVVRRSVRSPASSSTSRSLISNLLLGRRDLVVGGYGLTL